MSQIADKIAAIRANIATAAQAQGYNAARTRLMAVSKRQEGAAIDAVLAEGQRLFGENRVQEAYEHWTDRQQQYPDLELHLIGPLQTNKVKEAVALFDAIQTVDREKLAIKLGQEMQKQGRALPCYIEVNTGEEPQKAGIAPKNVPSFLEFCRSECGLNIVGLMCIPPQDDPPALHFALLKKLAQEQGLKELSMGMSSDYEKAAAQGATCVRVGSALFGARLS